MLLRLANHFGCVCAYVTGNFAGTISAKRAYVCIFTNTHAHVALTHKNVDGVNISLNMEIQTTTHTHIQYTYIHADRNKCIILLLITTTCNFIWGICFCTVLFHYLFLCIFVAVLAFFCMCIRIAKVIMMYPLK